MLYILQPFEVGHSHTPPIAKDIGQEADSFFHEDFLPKSSSWPVSGFDDELALEPICVISVN